MPVHAVDNCNVNGFRVAIWRPRQCPPVCTTDDISLFWELLYNSVFLHSAKIPPLVALVGNQNPKVYQRDWKCTHDQVHFIAFTTTALYEPEYLTQNTKHPTEAIFVYTSRLVMFWRVLRCENTNASTLRASQRERVQSCQWRSRPHVMPSRAPITTSRMWCTCKNTRPKHAATLYGIVCMKRMSTVL